MNIAYDAAHRIFKLDTDHTSYVIAVIDEEGFLCHASMEIKSATQTLHTCSAQASIHSCRQEITVTAALS